MRTEREERERISFERAVKELKANHKKITCVIDWARHMGYSRSYFSRKIKAMYGQPPKQLLKNTKMEKVEEEIVNDPEAIGYKIARNVGLNDEKALHKFLSIHFDTTLTELRRELV